MATPAAAYTDFHNWNFCTQNAFEVCMDFNLLRDGTTNDYQLDVTFVSSAAPAGQQGLMTAVGLLRSPSSADLDVSLITIISPLNWSVGAPQLSGGGPATREVGASSDSGATNGLSVGETVVIRFTSSNLATYDMDDLFARSHIQGIGPMDCSIKADSRAGGNLVDPVSAVDDRCGVPTTMVPEPMTMVLLGSGLLGVGLVRGRRRRPAMED